MADKTYDVYADLGDANQPRQSTGTNYSSTNTWMRIAADTVDAAARVIGLVFDLASQSGGAIPADATCTKAEIHAINIDSKSADDVRAWVHVLDEIAVDNWVTTFSYTGNEGDTPYPRMAGNDLPNSPCATKWSENNTTAGGEVSYTHADLKGLINDLIGAHPGVDIPSITVVIEGTAEAGDDGKAMDWAAREHATYSQPWLVLDWDEGGLVGDPGGTATVEGSLALDTDIAGDVTGAATAEGALSAERAMAGEVAGRGLVAAVRAFSVGDSWALLSTHHGGSSNIYGEAVGESYSALGVLRDRLDTRGVSIPAVERYAVAGSTSADWAAQDNSDLLAALAASDLAPVVVLSLGANDLAVDYGDVYDLADHGSWATAMSAIDTAIRSVLDDIIAARADVQILLPSYSNWAVGDIFSIPIPCQNFLANAFTASALEDVTEQNINELCQDYLQPVYDDIAADYSANVRVWAMWQALPMEPGGQRWRGTDYDLVINCIHLNAAGFAAWWDVILDDLAADSAAFFADPRLHNLSIDPAWTGEATGSATAEGVLGALRALTGDVSGSGTVDGTLAAARALAGATDGAATLEGTLGAARALVGDVIGSGTPEGDLTVAADVTLTGEATGAASAEGALVALRSLLGAADGQADALGVLSAAGLLVGSPTGSATPEGALSAMRLIAGQVAGSATVTGDLSTSPLLSGDATGTAAVEGLLIALRSLAGSVSGMADTAGALTGSAEITGDVVGTGTAEGALSALRRILGDVSGQADVSGALSAILDVVGDVSGAGAAEGLLAAARALIGTATGAASVEGAVTTETAQVLLSGAVDGLAAAEAEAIATRALSGDVAGSAAPVGSLTVVDRDLHIRRAHILAPRHRGRLLPP